VGGIRRVVELANQLIGKGHDITFFTPTGDPCTWLDCKAPIRKLEEGYGESCDILIINYEPQYKEPLKFKAKYNVYYILHYGVLYKYPDVCKASYRMPFIHLANSTWTANHIKDEIGKMPVIIPGGINSNHFRYDPEIKKEYDVLCYGSPRRWKGTGMIEEAVERAGLTLKKYEGEGIPQDQMYVEYNKAKMFVSASYFEGWNNPGIEAMSCGVPLIISNDGGSGEYVVNGYNAIVFPARNEDVLTRAIIKLNSDEYLRNNLSVNGIKTAEKFTWPKAGDKLDRVLNLIWNNNGNISIDEIKEFNSEKWNDINVNQYKLSLIININSRSDIRDIIVFFSCIKQQNFENYEIVVVVTGKNKIVTDFISNFDADINIVQGLGLNESNISGDNFAYLFLKDKVEVYSILSIFDKLKDKNYAEFFVENNDVNEIRYLIKKEHIDVFDVDMNIMKTKIINKGLKK
jgi:hypothetical protein